MRNLEKNFNKRIINYSKLVEYGFKKKGEKYTYKVNIINDTFQIDIIISETEKYSKLVDLENNTEYVVVDIDTATGEFVGKVREEYESKIQDIINKCTNREIFKSRQSKEIIEYIKQKYGDDLEFLWKKFDDNAIWRNKQNNKWYGLLLTISEKKLGIDSEKIVEIIDLRYQKGKTNEIIDNKTIFLGYHMNKNSWITIKLDNCIKTDIIFDLIDNSYRISLGNKTTIMEGTL